MNRCALCQQPQNDSDFAALVVEYHGNEPEPGDELVPGVPSTTPPDAERESGRPCSCKPPSCSPRTVRRWGQCSATS
jgi:hypothetical protein